MPFIHCNTTSSHSRYHLTLQMLSQRNRVPGESHTEDRAFTGTTPASKDAILSKASLITSSLMQ